MSASESKRPIPPLLVDETTTHVHAMTVVPANLRGVTSNRELVVGVIRDYETGVVRKVYWEVDQVPRRPSQVQDTVTARLNALEAQVEGLLKRP